MSFLCKLKNCCIVGSVVIVYNFMLDVMMNEIVWYVKQNNFSVCKKSILLTLCINPLWWNFIIDDCSYTWKMWLNDTAKEHKLNVKNWFNLTFVTHYHCLKLLCFSIVSLIHCFQFICVTLKERAYARLKSLGYASFFVNYQLSIPLAINAFKSCT